MSSLASERCGVLGVLVPADRANATTNGSAIDLSKFQRVLFILQLGSIDTTVDFKLQESATTGGTFTDIAGKSITQLTATDDNKQAIIELESPEMGAGKRYARCVFTSGAGTACLSSVVVLGVDPRFGPATDDDLASVAQVVS